MRKPRSLLDTKNSFGWLSIGLHWFATLAIILLWLVGQSISLQSVEQIDARRTLHITLGLIAWLPLVARMLWRYKSGSNVDIWTTHGLGNAR
jgi:cytochrome b561